MKVDEKSNLPKVLRALEVVNMWVEINEEGIDCYLFSKKFDSLHSFLMMITSDLGSF